MALRGTKSPESDEIADSEDQAKPIDWENSDDSNPVDDFYANRLKKAENDAATGESESNDIDSQEESPGPIPTRHVKKGKTRFDRIKNAVKKGGPTGGIIGVIIGTFGLSSVILAPASLLVNIHEIGTNHTAIGHEVGGKVGKSFSRAWFGDILCKTKIKCTLTRMTAKQIARLEARQVVVKTAPSKIPGLSRLVSATFPNGTVADTPTKWNNLATTDPEAYKLTRHWPRLQWLNPKSAFRLTVQKMNAKTVRWKSSKAEDKKQRVAENRKSLNAHTGAADGKDANTARIRGNIESKTNAAGEKITSRLTSLSGSLKTAGLYTTVTGCVAYDIIRAAQAAVNLAWHEELIAFALTFAEAGAAAKEGTIDWQTAEDFGDRLTAPITQEDIDRYPDDAYTQEQLGQTAMDSKGMAAALNGDYQSLNDYSSLYTAWSPSSAVWGSGIVSKIQERLPGGETTIKWGCKALINAVILAVKGCFKSKVAGAICVATGVGSYLVTKLYGQDIIALATEVMSKGAYELIAKANLTSELHGPALGDGLIAGLGVMNGYMDRANGLVVAGTRDQAKQAFVDTYTDDDYVKEKIAMAKFEASKNQLDLSNQYSFAGQFTSRFSSIPWNGTLFSILSNMANVFSINTFTGNAVHAKNGLFQPIAVYNSLEQIEGTMNNCKDPSLGEEAGINIPGLGESCQPVPIILSPVKECLNEEQKAGSERICIEEAIDYLSKTAKYEDEDGKEQPFIDEETGKPTDWDKYKRDSDDDYKNPFLMFMRHCGRDRTFWPGYTDRSVTVSALDEINLKDMILNDNDPISIVSSAFSTIEDIGKEITDPPDDWYDFTNCVAGKGRNNDKELAYMSFYYTMCIAVYANDEGLDYCWEDVPVANKVVSGDGWTYPTTCDTTVSDHFGTRGGAHRGVDIAGPLGTSIYAARGGKVIESGPATGFGNWIIIQHEIDGKKVDTVYGHMQAGDLLVKKGDTVEPGQEISKIGNEGGSTGPHLHFEIWEGGRLSGGQAVDPEPFINPVRKCL